MYKIHNEEVWTNFILDVIKILSLSKNVKVHTNAPTTIKIMLSAVCSSHDIIPIIYINEDDYVMISVGQGGSSTFSMYIEGGDNYAKLYGDDIKLYTKYIKTNISLPHDVYSKLCYKAKVVGVSVDELICSIICKKANNE